VRENVWVKREANTSLHWTLSHLEEMWDRGLQVELASIINWSSRHIPRVTTKEMLEGTRGGCIIQSDTAQG
jgi:hypothetical protein